MRCILPDSCECDFQLISIICRILFHQREADIQVTLESWHNNNGFEFEVLQAVFPATIELHDTKDFDTRPKAKFKATSRKLDLFFFVAVSVDAGFRISSKSQGVELAFFDSVLIIDCPMETQPIIAEYLFEEAKLQQLDDY